MGHESLYETLASIDHDNKATAPSIESVAGLPLYRKMKEFTGGNTSTGWSIQSFSVVPPFFLQRFLSPRNKESFRD